MSIFSMTKTLFKNMLHGPYTILYPLKEKEKFERTRGKIEINIEDCIFCGICSKRCPAGAIKVDKPSLTWSIERLSCIQCNYCGDVCPKKCLKMANNYTSPSYDNVRDEYSNARISNNQENN